MVIKKKAKAASEEKPEKKKKAEKAVKPPKMTPLERASSYAAPMLLGAVLCFTVFYALYRPFAPMLTILFTAAEFGLFMLFDVIKDKKVIGPVVYIALLVIVGYISLAMSFELMYRIRDYSAAISWFYGEDGNYSYQAEFIYAVFLFGGFFIISILYYFTQIRYRSLGVMLCILFPFVIYAKRAEEMPEAAVTIIITAYLAVMVHNRRVDPAVPRQKRGKLVINSSYLISIAIFVSVTGAVTMVIDKPTYRSKLEQDSNYFNYVQTGGTGSGDPDELPNESSDRSGPPSYTNRPVFYFNTNGAAQEYFMRVQTYNDFDGDKWTFDTDPENYGSAYSSVIPEYTTDDIIADMKKLAEQDESFEMPEGADRLPIKRAGQVHDDDFSPRYLPAPFATITDTAEYNELKYIKYPQGIILRVRPGSNIAPSVLNDSFDFYEQSAELYVYAAELGLDSKGYIDMLERAEENGEDTGGLLEDYRNAYDSFTAMTGVSDRLAELSYEITKDAKSDIEKASRLEKYFTLSGYEYSLDYVPVDDSIDYFVFESKTGYCANYATAMTLMARAAGLPARYVEGYAAFEKTEDDEYVIRDSHAHAFVEVYIPGAGWMTFDPTVPGYMENTGDDDSFSASAILRILSRFLFVIIVAFVVVFVLLFDRIKELIFRIRLRFMKPSEKTLALYANLIRLMSHSSGQDHSTYTVKMLRKDISSTRGAVPEKLLTLFEKTCFGSHAASEEEFSEAYSEYKACYKYLRKVPKAKTLEKMKNA